LPFYEEAEGDEEVKLGQYIIQEDPDRADYFILTNRVKDEETEVRLTKELTFEGQPRFFDFFINQFTGQ
jgi:hypothetical protein